MRCLLPKVGASVHKPSRSSCHQNLHNTYLSPQCHYMQPLIQADWLSPSWNYCKCMTWCNTTVKVIGLTRSHSKGKPKIIGEEVLGRDFAHIDTHANTTTVLQIPGCPPPHEVMLQPCNSRHCNMHHTRIKSQTLMSDRLKRCTYSNRYFASK